MEKFVLDNLNGKEKTWLVFDYIWKWFEYHANQRLSAFRFYLIAVAAVIGVIASQKPDIALKDMHVLHEALLLFSLVFLFLDIRNAQLVKHAQDALKIFEKEQGLRDTIYGLRHIDLSNRKDFISHAFWIRALYVIVGVFSFCMIPKHCLIQCFCK